MCTHRPRYTASPTLKCILPGDALTLPIVYARNTSAVRFGPFQLQPPRRRRAAQPAQPSVSRVTMAGGSRFATLIPGDGVAEQVITSGLSSFL